MKATDGKGTQMEDQEKRVDAKAEAAGHVPMERWLLVIFMLVVLALALAYLFAPYVLESINANIRKIFGFLS